MSTIPVLISPEVQAALTHKKPVLALESTVITHGMPYPQNAETALLLEQTARDLGVIPATIAVIDGVFRVGLPSPEIHDLAQRKDCVKLSIRDLAPAVQSHMTGGTTVAATMHIAHLVGISVFSTGGVGGVHRGAEETFDISADLPALASIPMIVVCAGAKLILDIPKTLEYLETMSVTVLGYQTDRFAAFYSRTTPYPVTRCESATQIADILRYQQRIGVNKALLVVNPIPREHELAYDEMDAVIQVAIEDSKRLGIRGKDSTPYLLQRLYELTRGKSLVANIALIQNNVRVGAQIARELCETHSS